MNSPAACRPVSDSEPRPFEVIRRRDTGPGYWRSNKASSGPKLGISPVEVGCVSVNGNGEFVNDRSQSRFYRPPQSLRGGDAASKAAAAAVVDVCWDLSHGYETWIRRDDSLDDFLDGLLWWLQVHGHAPTHDTAAVADDGGGRSTDVTETAADAAAACQTASKAAPQAARFADLICCRSLIAKLLRTPFQTHPTCSGWRIIVCRYNGVLYGNDKDGNKTSPNGGYFRDRKQDLGFYRGYKFETYVTAHTKDAEPDQEAPVNNKQSLLSVVKTCLGKHQLAYIADIDCFDPTTNQPIELKTTLLLPDNKRGQDNFKRYQMLAWWSQCVLNGTNKIVCGFRDKKFIVRQLREYSTSQLPRQAAKLRGAWNTEESFKFCNQFVDYIKRTVTEDVDKAIYVFTYNPPVDNQHVTCQVHAAGSGGYSQHAFLPSWFTGDTVHCRRTGAAAAAAAAAKPDVSSEETAAEQHDTPDINLLKLSAN